MTRILLLFATFFSLTLNAMAASAVDQAVDHPMSSMEDAFDCLRNVTRNVSCTEPPLTYVALIQQSSIEGRFAVLKMVENGGPMTGDEVNRIFDLFDVLLLHLNDTITTNDDGEKLATIQQITELMNEAHAPFKIAPLE